MGLLPACALVIVLAASAQHSLGDLMRQADAAYRAGDLDKAATLFRQVLQQDPAVTPAHMLLGIISAQRNQWEDAIQHLSAVVRVAPNNAHAHFFLGKAYQSQEKWAEAAQSFSKARENQFPDRDRLMIELALAQTESGQAQEALSSLRSIEPPSDKKLAAQYHAARAAAHQKLDQPTLSIEAIRQALEANGYDPPYWHFLISSLISTGQTEMALTEAIAAQKRFPDHPDILYQFGIAGHFVDELPFSELALRNLTEAWPDDPRVLVLEGLVRRKQGKVQEANRAFTIAAQRGVREAHLFLGLALSELGDQQAAERELRLALRHFPHHGQVLFALGKILSSRNPQEALALLQKAEKYIPESASVHYRLSVLYSRLDQPEKAKHHLDLYRQFRQEEREFMDTVLSSPGR